MKINRDRKIKRESWDAPSDGTARNHVIRHEIQRLSDNIQKDGGGTIQKFHITRSKSNKSILFFIVFHRGRPRIRQSYGGEPIFKYPFLNFISFLERIVARGSIISQRNGRGRVAGYPWIASNESEMNARTNSPLFSFPEKFDVSVFAKTGNGFGAICKKNAHSTKLSLSPSSFSFSLFSLFLSPGGKIFEVGRMGGRGGWRGQVKKDPAFSQSGRLLRF